MRKDTFLGTNDKYPGEFEPFRGMHGHQLHGIDILAFALVARFKRSLREKPLHRRRNLIISRRESQKIFRQSFVFKPPFSGCDHFLHVLKAIRAILIFFVAGLEPGSLNDMCHRIRKRHILSCLTQREDQVAKGCQAPRQLVAHLNQCGPKALTTCTG